MTYLHIPVRCLRLAASGYCLAQASQAVELRFTNLLTGKVQLVVSVEGSGTERSQHVALTGLPASMPANCWSMGNPWLFRSGSLFADS